jgi:hypothetical protein
MWRSDSAFSGSGTEIERRVAGKKRADIAAGVESFDRELVILPPIVGNIEPASLDREIEIAEAVMSSHPPIHETRPGPASGTQTFDEHFAVG